MNGGIFLIQDDDKLVEMVEQAYESEDLLQELLAKYPSLLAGDQMDTSAPRRWLLVSREASLPSEEDGEGRWSVDHLFLDQDAIPTLVEVKRSTDTRIRREVVGQMLDYAANAVVYWPIESIRAKFEASCKDKGIEPEQALSEFLSDDINPEQFWQKTKTNLQAGKIRMVFVADDIPTELRRVVEFLNEQMDPAEVLAVEIRQYIGRSLKTLVPRVMGLTAEAEKKKSSGLSKQWDKSSFFQDLRAKRGAEEARFACKIFEWAETRNFRIWWGKGSRDGSFFTMFDYRGVPHYLIAVWTYGKVEIQFQMMKMQSPFDNESKRLELLRRLNEIPGIAISPEAISKRPNIPLTIFKNEDVLKKFLETLDWAIQEIKSS